MTDNNELTVLELNDVKYRLGKSIYAELDMSLERFVELLGRDLYCPTLSQAPTSSTVSYKDTDDTVNTFQAGQPCRWQEGNAWRLAVCTNNIGTSATWYVLPTKVSELTNDAGYLTQHQDITGKLDKTEASETYLTQTDASNTYLGKGAKAASAVIADSATNATSATTATNLASAPSLVADGNDIKVTAGGKTSNGFTVPFATSAGSCTGNADTATKATQDGTGNVIVDTYATKSEVSDGLSGKVDKDGTKVLSSNDFTDKLKEKLEGLNNYNDTDINNAISGLQNQLNTLVSGDASTAIDSFNEIIAFLDGIKEDEDLASIISSIEQQIAGKQDKIDNLDAIKSGAQAGSTAVQPGDLHAVATSGSYTDLANKPTIPDALADLSADETHRTVTDSEKAAWNAKSNFSGSYTDLTNKPNIPDISGKLDKTEASETYLTKADASQAYLGKNDKAASAATADSVDWDNVDGRPTKLSELEDDVVEGNYLPLSGGTIEGQLDIKSSISVDDNIYATKLTLFPNDGWSDGENIRPWYGYHFIGTNDPLSTTFSSYYGMTFKTAACDLTMDTGGVAIKRPYSRYALDVEGIIAASQKMIINGNDVWHAGNDGEGSGLDADMLDGKQLHEIRNYAFGAYEARVIPEGTDIDALYGDDNYGLWVSLDNTPYLNAPYSNFSLLVVRVMQAYDCQILLPYETHYKLQYRSHIYSGGTMHWTEWKQIAFTDSDITGNAASATKATQDGNGNVIADTYATKGEVNEKQDAVLKFTNLTASSWVSDSTYADYPYRCDLSCSGVTSSNFAEVVFGIEQALSGAYAPICETKTNVVSIWSSENTTTTIPTIIITK